MFCPECGAKNDDGSLFCGECGTRLIEEEKVQPADDREREAKAPNEQENPQPGGGPQRGFQPGGGPQRGFQPGGEPQRGFQPGEGSQKGSSMNGGYYQGNPQPDMNQQMRSQQPRPQQPRPQRSGTVKTRKPVSKTAIGIVIEVIAAIALIIGIGKVLSDKFSPEKVAMDYWKAAAACEWASAYEYCDFPDSELLTKQMYINANSNNTEPIPYKSVHITDAGTAAGKMLDQYADGLNELGSLFGVDVNDTVEQAKKQLNATDARNYVVEYLTKGSAEKEYSYLSLTKTGKKCFLFWDEWKVSSSDSWVKDVQFEIPQAATMSLNGVSVQGTVETMEEERQRITIPYLFAGDYQMEVSEDGMEPYRKVIHINSYGCEDSYVYLLPAKETIQTLAQQAGDDVKLVLDSALEGKDFSEIQSRFTQQAISDGYVKNDYEDLKELKGDGEDSGIISLSLKNMKTTLTGDVSERYVYLKMTADMEKTYRQYWTDTPGEYSGDITLEIVYMRDGDEWKLAELPVSYYDIS